MSFILRNMRSASVAGRGSKAGSGTLWQYRTEDSLAFILSADYFLALGEVLVPGDLIRVNRVSNLDRSNELLIESVLVTVLTSSSSGVTTQLSSFAPPPDPVTPVPPAAPVNVSATETTPGVVSITWDYNATEPVALFYVQRDGSDLPNPVAANATRLFVDTTASLGSHSYTVQAFNAAAGRGPVSAGDAVTVTAPVLTIDTPTGVLTDATTTTLSVTWTYAGANPNNHDGFLLELQDASGSVLSFSPTLGKAARTHTFTALSPSTTYKVVVSAVKSGGAGGVALYSTAAVTQATDAGLTPPSVFTINAVTAASSSSLLVTWAWTAGYNPPAFAVDVIGPGGFFIQFLTAGVQRQYVPTGLVPSTTYSVTVSAVDAQGGAYAVTPAVQGTTSAGTSGSPLALLAADLTIGGQVGVPFSADPYLATGGVAPYTWSVRSTLPSGVTFTSVAQQGIWSGTPAVGSHGTVGVGIRVTDALGAFVDLTPTLTILPASIVITPHASMDLTADSGVAYDSQVWTISGGVAPYSIVVNGQLPTSINVTTTATTVKLSGTSTSTVSGGYSFTIDVTDAAAGSASVQYTLTYTASVAVNRAPVLASGTPTTYTKQEGSASSTILDADNLITDPDGDTLTYTLTTFTPATGTAPSLSTVGAVTTIGATGLTFNKTTGVLSGSPSAGTSAQSPWSFAISADDGQGAPLGLARRGPLAPVIGFPYPNLSTAGLYASGGNTTGDGYAYSIVSGTLPSWLGTGVSSTTGLYTGGSPGNVTAGTVGPIVFRVTDDAAVTRDLSVTFTPQAGVTETFASRVAGTWYATDFQKVYIGGVEVPSRQITALNTTADIDQQDGEAGTVGTLWGERNGAAVGIGTAPARTGRLDWIDDPTGRQAKVAKWIRKDGDAGQGIGWIKRLDGASAGSVGGTYQKKIFYQYVFYADRDFYGRRDVWPLGGGTKIMYIGDGNGHGQVVITLGATGIFGFFIDGGPGMGTPSIDPTGVGRAPSPNPWNNSNLRNYQPRPGIVYPPSAAGKIAWYEAAGVLKWSSAGIDGDLGSSISAVSYPSKIVTGAQTPYLDEREHLIEGIDQGWPPQCCVTGKVGRIHLDEWNVIQIGVEYKHPALSTLCIWTAKSGEEPILRVSMVDAVAFMSGSAVGQQVVWCGWQSTNTPAISIPSTVSFLSGELVVSPNRIQAPGGWWPQLPAGLTG